MTSVADVTSGTEVHVRRPDWVAHVLDEAADPPRAVLLHLPSGRRTGLSDTATRVWQEIVAAGADGIEAATLAARVAPEYGVDAGIIEDDISALIAQLLEGEWVEPVEPRGDEPS